MSFLKDLFCEPPRSEELKEIKEKFNKVCTNAHQAGKVYKNNKDMNKWSEEAYERGEEFFYTEPINPDKPLAGLKLSQPKYVYKLKKDLTPEEFNKLFGGE